MRRTLTVLAAVALSAAVIAQGCIRFTENDIARAQLNRLTASVRGLRITYVKADFWHRTITIEGLAYHRSGLAAFAARVTFGYGSAKRPPFAAMAAETAPPAPGVALDHLSAENLTIDVNGSHYEIPRVDVSGTSMTKADFDAIFDSKSAIPLADRVATLDYPRRASQFPRSPSTRKRPMRC